MELYQLYQASYLDSLIIFMFLLYTLYCLTGLRPEHSSLALYLSVSSAVFFIFYNVTSYRHILEENPYPGAAPTHPYWYYFICTFLIAAVFSHYFLRGSIFVKITYILYFISILQLYQIICSPLYEAIEDLTAKQFMIGDLATSFCRYLLLFFFSMLLRRFKIEISAIRYKPQYLIMLLFPISLIVFYQFSIQNSRIEEYSEPILAAIVLPNLIVMYYLFSSMINFYRQKENLTAALYETKNQMARYRYSIELDERIKKERHELKNNYLYIQSLLRMGQYDQLDSYLSGYVEEKMDAISSISTGNLMIDYLLNLKIAEARKKGIKVYTEILVPEHMPVNEEGFCTIFLNLIDNAIEASRQELNADIQITLKAIQAYLSCSISNKVNPQRILANPDFTTTKKDPGNHGLGRIIVKETVEACNGILKDSLDGNYYTVRFMLPFS